MHPASWVAVGLGIFLVLVLLWLFYGKKLLAWLRRPKLEVKMDMSPPDCVRKTLAMFDEVSQEFIGEADSYCVRFRVLNRGRIPATNIEVYCLRIMKDYGGGEYERLEGCTPINLLWESDLAEDRVYYPSLYKGQGGTCRLGHVIRPRDKYWRPGTGPEYLGVEPGATVFTMDSTLSGTKRPDSLTYLVPPEVNLPEGSYVLDLMVSADNARPEPVRIEVDLDGRWYSDAESMWGRGLSVKKLHGILAG
jgi:hypothetical protein